ncbi:hypothetical protein BY458DRAFT_480852 [Sporodiniella umbellata]|nr:hypothetical protein BY458DRAFT_480852 [Sporodiniella umbellata]
MSDKPLVALSVENWNEEQKIAIARASGQALTQSSLDKPWSTELWNHLLAYLKLDQEQLMNHPLSLEEAKERIQDIRIDVLLDLVALALYGQKQDMNYDARSRRFLLELEHLLDLSRGDLNSVERSVSQQIYYALEEQEQKNDASSSSIKKALKKGAQNNKALRWAATGAGIVGGGAIIALTGGLAAPLLAPFLVGITGAGFFATAGGVALVTSLFGLTGGGLAGWKMHRRMKGISEFEFTRILNDPDLPPIPSLHCTICVSGFLMEENDAKAPWESAFTGKHGNNNDIFCLEYEKNELLQLGYSFQKFVRDSAVKYAGIEVAKTTMLKAVFAAVALPATILKVADVIDNPWQIAADRSKKAGLVLADVLQEKVQGNRPCNLIGYSCGCLVIWNCLLELQKRGCVRMIDHVVMMGAPISIEDQAEWLAAESVVTGDFVNCYSTRDWVLGFIYRLHSLSTSVAGLEPVKIGKIRNFEISSVDGHTKYPEFVKSILDQIDLE